MGGNMAEKDKETKSSRQESEKEPEKQIKVVSTVKAVRELLHDEQIKISCFRVYAELEHILRGMKRAQKTFIDLIEFVQDGNDKIMHAVYIGRYGLPSAADGKYLLGQGYWILYGHGMSYSDEDNEIKQLRKLIQQNSIKLRHANVENNALDEYSKSRGLFENTAYKIES